MTCPPLLQTPPKSTSDAVTTSAPAMVREDTPWPGAGKMSGNLFKERNWLLPKGYLAMEGEKEGVIIELNFSLTFYCNRNLVP